jgi:hypothetical protein
MRLGKLRRVLSQIVIVGLPAVVAGPSTGCGLFEECETTHFRHVDIDMPADADTQFLIDRCGVDVEQCTVLCNQILEREQLGGSLDECDVTIEADAARIDLVYTVWNGGSGCPVAGRRPSSLVAPAHDPAGGAAGAWLAHAAWLEAASVHAFVMLVRELTELGAPPRLIRDARLAARDEVLHTELMTRLARRYGARPPVVTAPAYRPRPLVELAIENAAEGCVRETWGAVVALWQARTARDPFARAIFDVIARDEARHAGLAWAIDRWIRPRLDARAIARVDAARVRATEELRAEQPAVGIPAIGVPGGDELRDLVARTDRALWSGGVSC